MAYFPCDHGHANPLGRNHSIYVAFGSGLDMRRHRLRLCAAHAADVYQNLTEFEVPVSDSADGSWQGSTNCISCLKPMGKPGWNCFVTCYPAHDERKDYWAQLHISCRLPAYLADMRQEPLPGLPSATP